MSTIHLHQTTTLTPEQYIAGLTDSGPGPAKLFGNSADEYLKVHSQSGSQAEVTEGSGPQRFHGRVIILVNEHTASAGEMVAAFAEENKLATIVGTKTPGRLLSGSTLGPGSPLTRREVPRRCRLARRAPLVSQTPRSLQ